MQGKQIRALMIGAHQDDCEVSSGGLAALYRAAGHIVKYISVTNGDTGHYQIGGNELARMRTAELARSCVLIGAESEVFDIHSNGLEADIPTRERMVGAIRLFKPDVIFTHRTNDYHPDHRRTAILVQDSSYAIKVPHVCPLIPCLRYTPVIMYFGDRFMKPNPFIADVAVDIDSVSEIKNKMISCHESQVFDWLPWVDGYTGDIPKDAAGRHAWIDERWMSRGVQYASQFHDLLSKRYGQERAEKIRYAEVFEIS